MKNRIGLIILVLICLGMGIGLIAIKKQAIEQQRRDAETINSLSNQWNFTKAKLSEESQHIASISQNLDTEKKAHAELASTFTQVSNNLTQTSADLAKTEETLKAREEEIKKRDATITALEGKNQDLDKQALNLRTSITNLTGQIEETRRKLAASEGDKAILETNLKRLLAEKAELERQFNDLTILRAQVVKLKEEMTIARRLEWIRMGLFAGEQRGAQRVMQGIFPSQALARAPKPSYDLNVEVTSDGSVKVIPPSPATNRPAGTNANIKW